MTFGAYESPVEMEKAAILYIHLRNRQKYFMRKIKETRAIGKYKSVIKSLKKKAGAYAQLAQYCTEAMKTFEKRILNPKLIYKHPIHFVFLNPPKGWNR